MNTANLDFVVYILCACALYIVIIYSGWFFPSFFWANVEPKSKHRTSRILADRSRWFGIHLVCASTAVVRRICGGDSNAKNPRKECRPFESLCKYAGIATGARDVSGREDVLKCCAALNKPPNHMREWFWKWLSLFLYVKNTLTPKRGEKRRSQNYGNASRLLQKKV